MYMLDRVPSPRETLEAVSTNNITTDSIITPHSLQLIIAYDVLYGVGFVTLMAVILTACFSKSAQRSSLWIAAVSAWAFIAFANILLLGQQTGPQPNRHFCLMQATIIYASPAYAAMTSAVYMVQAYCSICSSFSLNRLSHSQKFIVFLHSIPAIILVFIISEVIFIGQIHPDTVQRDPSGMYCHLTSSTPGHVTAGITIVGMLIILSMEACIFVIIRQSTKLINSVQQERPDSIVLSRNDFSREAFIRMACFSSWALVCIGLSFIVYLPQKIISNTDAQLVQSTLPCVATITFGTQRDVMKAWKFWAKRPTRNESQMPNFLITPSSQGTDNSNLTDSRT